MRGPTNVAPGAVVVQQQTMRHSRRRRIAFWVNIALLLAAAIPGIIALAADEPAGLVVGRGLDHRPLLRPHFQRSNPGPGERSEHMISRRVEGRRP